MLDNARVLLVRFSANSSNECTGVRVWRRARCIAFGAKQTPLNSFQSKRVQRRHANGPCSNLCNGLSEARRPGSRCR
ncbi:unnamed protein product [Periconia digitata]|uniref:Uncharacterized protein n=1 Tax=Periconia digitata TaxID=1303443 RepID=A0A9W4U550_9PLEO|nr:unnamed protein product [Periconia digitata]